MENVINITRMINYYKEKFRQAFKELKTKGERYKQIPNLITATRLVAAPCFIIPAALSKNILLLVIFITIFSLTDAIDGFIARKYNLISELGMDLDAICDKVFALSLLISASIFKPVLLCNLFAEVVIAVINIREKIHNRAPKSLLVGKIKTCVLYPLLGLAFLNTIVSVQEIFNTFLAATISMQMLTITSYLIKYEGEQHENTKLNKHIPEEVNENIEK